VSTLYAVIILIAIWLDAGLIATSPGKDDDAGRP
jgi:hypothetical protein